MLAQMGQHNVCNSGRYFILSQNNNSHTNGLCNSSKNLNVVSELYLNDNSKIWGLHILLMKRILKVTFQIIAALQQHFHSSLPSPSSSSMSSDPAEYTIGLKDY
jgi:hypothetical protein